MLGTQRASAKTAKAISEAGKWFLSECIYWGRIGRDDHNNQEILTPFDAKSARTSKQGLTEEAGQGISLEIALVGCCLWLLARVIGWWARIGWQGMSREIARRVVALFHLPPRPWMQACFKFIGPLCISMHHCSLHSLHSPLLLAKQAAARLQNMGWQCTKCLYLMPIHSNAIISQLCKFHFFELQCFHIKFVLTTPCMTYVHHWIGLMCDLKITAATENRNL